MITDDHVSFEIANLLRDKGFDEFCPNCYNTVTTPYLTTTDLEEGSIGHQIYAPTVYEAMNWLRVKHNIHISIDTRVITPSFCVYLSSTDGQTFGLVIDTYFDDKAFMTFNEACDAAIRYCLENLI